MNDKFDTASNLLDIWLVLRRADDSIQHGFNIMRRCCKDEIDYAEALWWTFTYSGGETDVSVRRTSTSVYSLIEQLTQDIRSGIDNHLDDLASEVEFHLDGTESEHVEHKLLQRMLLQIEIFKSAVAFSIKNKEYGVVKTLLDHTLVLQAGVTSALARLLLTKDPGFDAELNHYMGDIEEKLTDSTRETAALWLLGNNGMMFFLTTDAMREWAHLSMRQKQAHPFLREHPGWVIYAWSDIISDKNRIRICPIEELPKDYSIVDSPLVSASTAAEGVEGVGAVGGSHEQ